MLIGSIVSHELAHASVVLVKTKGTVAVCIGSPEPTPHAKVGRFSGGVAGRGWATRAEATEAVRRLRASSPGRYSIES